MHTFNHLAFEKFYTKAEALPAPPGPITARAAHQSHSTM
jgi:hypothetical protein